MRKITWAIFFILFYRNIILSGNTPGTNILMHSEYGSFNRVYRSLEYKENNAETFSVRMINLGTEYRTKDGQGNTSGGGLVYTDIHEGRKFNVNHYEIQPSTSIFVPYFFIGHDSGLWAAEIGLSYYLTFYDRRTRSYYNPDGGITEKESKTSRMERDESYVIPNLMVRLLPEKGYHVKIRFGRERFHAVDSLFNLGFIYPYKRHIGEFYFSLPTHISGYFPESNRRFGFTYSYSLGIVSLGATAGYLAYNKMGGGDGNMYILDPDNFSFGLNMKAEW